MTTQNELNFKTTAIILFFAVLLSPSLFSQFEYMGTIPYEKRGNFYQYEGNSVIRTNSSLYYLSRNYERQLYVLKDGEKSPKLVKDFGYDEIYSRFYGYNDNIYFFVRTNFSGPLKLFKCNENNEVSEIYNQYVDDGMGNSRLHNENLYYQVKQSNENRIFKYNTELNILDTIHRNNKKVRLLNVYDEGVLFFEEINIQSVDLAFLDHNGNKTSLYSGGVASTLHSWSESGVLPTSDDLNWYVKIQKSDTNVNILQINKNSLLTKVISGENIQEIHPNQNNKYNVSTSGYAGGLYSAEIVNDSLLLGSKIGLKNELRSSNYSYSLESTQNKLFSIVDIDFGMELGAVNHEDSITLIKDLNEGKFSSIPFRYCDNGGYPSYKTAFFEHENKSYAFLSNGNDESVYLYEVRQDTLISLSKAPEFNSSRVRILPFEDYIYYITQNSQTELSSVYRWKWDAPINPQPTNKVFDSPTWYTEIGFDKENMPCAGYASNLRTQNVILDKEGSTYVSFINNQYGGLAKDNLIYDLANKAQVKSKMSDVYAKYNALGELQWMRGIGSTNKLFDSFDQFSINSNGDVNIFGNFNQTGYFDEDTLEVIGSYRYWAKLDSETGDVVRVKPLYKTTYVDDPEFFQVDTDDEDFMYLSGKYNGFELDLSDTILISDWSHQSFIAKYDQDGNVVWARNILTSWDDYIGDIRNVELNNETEEIMVFCSQNREWYCDTERWRGVLIIYDFNGKEKQRQNITGNGKHFNGLSTQLKDNKTLIKGTFGGSIGSDIFEFQTGMGEDCFVESEYTFIYDQKQNRVQRASVTLSENVMVPMEVKQDGGYLYYLGVDLKTYNFVIERYDLEGNYKGKKIINQSASHGDFDVQDGSFVLIGSNFAADTEYPIADTWRPSDVLSILKFEINDWDMTPQNTRPMDIRNIAYNLGLNVYPNPFTSTFEIDFQDMEYDFEKYQISNAMGQIIMEGVVLDQNFLKINLEQEKQGVYFLKLYGENEGKTIKLMKL